MKITEAQLRRLVREQTGQRVGVRSLTRAALEHINQMHRVDYSDLGSYLFDNNDIDDDDRLWEMIEYVLESDRLGLLYNAEDNTFSID